MSLLLLNKRRKTSSAPPSSDPHWNNVVLYLKGDGADGSTNIIDSSNSNKTIIRNGNPTISTTQSKYGGSSISNIPASSSLLVETSSDFDFTGTDYTIELWCYPTGLSSYQCIFTNTTQANNGMILYTSGLNNLRLWIANQVVELASISGNNQWYHIALVGQNSTNAHKIYVNGILKLTNTKIMNAGTSTPFYVGRTPLTTLYRFPAYIDSLRVTKGVARYTANFNPETDTYLAY
jgi:hypothetical protein